MDKPSETMLQQLRGRKFDGLCLMAVGFLGITLATTLAFGQAVAGVGQAAPMAKHKKTHKAAPAPAPEPVTVVLPPAPPPPPPTPGELPPNAPNVTYEDGQLTIVAENSTLSQVLAAVSTRIGAAMEVPMGAGSERVWAQIGPGPARAVLASLLAGTELDYVIQAADADPSQIQSVLLTQRNKGPRTGDANGGTQNAALQGYNTRLPSRFRNSAQDSSAGDSTAVPESSPAPAAPAEPNVAEVPAPTVDAAAATPDNTGSGPAASIPTVAAIATRVPSAITDADAHPAPTGNTEQGVPQLMSLFELRRQLQEQQNTQQKTSASR